MTDLTPPRRPARRRLLVLGSVAVGVLALAAPAVARSGDDNPSLDDQTEATSGTSPNSTPGSTSDVTTPASTPGTVPDDNTTSTTFDDDDTTSTTFDDDDDDTTSTTFDDDGPLPESFTKQYTLLGGTVTVSFANGVLTLDEATPAAGFTVESESRGDRVKVEFESDSHESELEVRVDDGRLRVEVEEEADDGGHHGNDDGGDDSGHHSGGDDD